MYSVNLPLRAFLFSCAQIPLTLFNTSINKSEVSSSVRFPYHKHEALYSKNLRYKSGTIDFKSLKYLPLKSIPLYKWILNYSDGKNSLIDISNKCDIKFEHILEAAKDLEMKDLIK